MSLSPLLAAYDQVILDLDGCVYVGDEAVPGAAEAISTLRHAGKRIAFVTNDARRAPEDYVRKLWSLGIQASLEEVVTVGSALQHMLAEGRSRRPTYVIGSEAIFRHVADAGQRIVNGAANEAEAEVVVVAGHDELHFNELRVATQAVVGGAEMIATSRDRTFPADDGLRPGTGAVVAALEYATECSARVIGKPDPQVFHTVLDRFSPGRALVVGDRLDSDLEGAAAAGLDGAIVLTGVSSSSEAEAAESPAPVAVAEDLRALVIQS